MFENLFENRNRTVSDLIKLGDYLGRSLRENVSIFKIDVEEQSVCYVTESNKVIAGTYDLTEGLRLEDIVVEDVAEFLDEARFDSLVDNKISGFVKNIYEDSHKQAKSSFDDLLYLWESRLKFKNIKNKLEEKTLRFNESSQIIGTKEFDNFLEIAPQLVTYLRENKSKISKISEIRSAVRLSQTISEAFDIPKVDYEELTEDGTYSVNQTSETSIYEMICRHELIKKELLEHKANFDTVWASNQKVQNLAGLIYSDEDTVHRALVEAVKQVPYISLASKKQLTETFKNALNLNKVKDISIADIQNFASAIFEMKKPIKAEFISHLNERYGINVQNLKDPATFKSLLNTQVQIFETLAKISPKKSVLRDVLMDLAESLAKKNGVEAIDCNEVIQEVFIAAGYDDLVINESLNNYLDFEKIASDLDKVGGILRMIKGSGAAAGQPAAMGGMPQAAQGMPEPEGGDMEGNDDPDVPQPASGMEDDDVSAQPLTPEDAEEMPPEMAGAEGEEGMEGMEDMEAGEVEPSEEEVLGKMKELEDLISSLKMQIGGEGEEGGDDIDAEQEALEDEEEGLEAEHDDLHDQEDEVEEDEAELDSEQDELEAEEDEEEEE
jgi:hypothetical protein